jgi:hypothetical protein
MLIIDSPETMALALASPLDPMLESLMRLRVEQLTGYEGYNLDDLALFVIVEPADTLPEIEAAVGISLTVNIVDGAKWPSPDFTPNWEVCERFGHIWECVWVTDDSGYGTVALLEDREGVDSVLLDLCRTFGQPGDLSTKAGLSGIE